MDPTQRLGRTTAPMAASAPVQRRLKVGGRRCHRVHTVTTPPYVADALDCSARFRCIVWCLHCRTRWGRFPVSTCYGTAGRLRSGRWWTTAQSGCGASVALEFGDGRDGRIHFPPLVMPSGVLGPRWQGVRAELHSHCVCTVSTMAPQKLRWRTHCSRGSVDGAMPVVGDGVRHVVYSHLRLRGAAVNATHYA